MKVQTIYIIIGIFLLVVLGEAQGGSVADSLHIQATVPPQLQYQIISEPTEIEITKKDKKKGYKDIRKGTTVSVTTNNPNGYILSVCYPKGKPYTSIQVSDGTSTYELLPFGCVDFHEPYNGPAEEKDITYRLYLPPDIQLKTYKWAVVVTASLI
jgi:hypothetical protein